MNSKKAKALRKIASFTAQRQGIDTNTRTLIEIESRRKYHFELLRDLDGSPIFDSESGRHKYNAKFVAYGQMRNDPETVRGIYRALKRMNKTSTIGK